MKQISTKKKILYIISILIIIAGALIVYFKGFNVELAYQKTQQIGIYINSTINLSEIEEITNEVFGEEKVVLQIVEMFEDTVAIKAKTITEEQKATIIDKVNEKYELELSADDVVIETIPNERIRDLLKPYVLPLIIATLIILIYMAIRYKNLGITKVWCKVVSYNVFVQLILFSIFAIVRLPMGRLTIPIMLAVYLISMLIITNKLEKDLQKHKLEKNKEEN